MNIELQCCGLGMLVFLLLYLLKEKSLKYSGRTRYMVALISCMICLTLDITSIIGIHLAYKEVFAPWVARLICKLYVLSLGVQAYQGFQYAASEFFAVGSHKGLRIFYRIWMVVGGIAIMALPITYFEDGRLVYSDGLSTYATYVVVLVYLVSTIVMAFVGKRTSKIRKYSILIWQGMWVLAAILQFAFQGLLLVGFAAAFGMILLYALLENPHDEIDRVTGQFTSTALYTYATDLMMQHKSFSSVTYRYQFINKNIDYETNRLLLVNIANILSEEKDALVFRNSDNGFTVIYNNSGDAKENMEYNISKIKEITNRPMAVNVTYVEDSKAFISSEEYFRFLHYTEFEYGAKDFLSADSETIGEMRDYFDTIDMINDALKDGRVEVFYQPIYNIAKGKFNSAEALVRIISKEGDIIYPGKFIPVAEQCGLIDKVGCEVFRQVCEFLSNGNLRKMGLEYIEVNLSVAQFDKDNPSKFINEMVQKYGINPKWINLEITETGFNSAKQLILKNMDILLDRGITFSLDDFGTGRSNLDYFVEMPVSIVKFDYTFTQSYFKSDKAKFVIEGMIDMLKKMNLAIVAEGVETKEVLDTMVKLGVSYIQGFYFSKALPKDKFLNFLGENN